MIERFNAVILNQATGRNVLLWLGLVVFWIAVFGTVLIPAFEAATAGFSPVDIAFPTTPELIFGQLPVYTQASFRAYAWFAVADFLYPPSMAMFIATLWAWLFKKTPNRLFGACKISGILTLPFLAASLDWLENTGFLIVIFSYPPELREVAEMACLFKKAKILIHGADIGLTVLFVSVSLFVRQRSRRRFS